MCLSCSSPGNMDRNQTERDPTTPVPSLSTPGWGEGIPSGFHHACSNLEKETEAGNSSQKHPLGFFQPASSAPQHPSSPLLSHLSQDSHTKLAGVQEHSKDAAPSIHCLHNDPVTPTLPTAARGRLCIKGSVLKREEYFPRRNQHPHKTKS